MKVAALVTWVLTAGGGFFLLATWIGKGGVRQSTTSRFPPALIFGHFALAATGLVVWIIYVITDTDALAWVAFVILLPVALLGFGMLARWIPTYRAERATKGRSAAATVTGGRVPESHFPVPTVVAHGLLAVTTLVLVFLTAIGVGGS
jgi:manganese efflux pump family protein